MKKLKWIFRILIGLALLCILAATVLLITIDPNDYKPQIEQAFAEHTGRQLTIDGKLSWSFFPRLGIAIGTTSVNNASGFAQQAFAKIDAIKVNVEVMPLLRREVRVDVIELKGLNLLLQKNKAGRSNWDDFLQTAQHTDQAPSSQPADKPSDSKAPELAALAIGGLAIEDAQVIWDDASSAQKLALKRVNLRTGKVTLDQPVSVELQFELENAEPAIRLKTQFSSTLHFDLNKQNYAAEQLRLQLDLAGASIPGGALSLLTQGRLGADLQQQTAEIGPLDISTGALLLKLHANASHLDSKPELRGQLAAPSFDLRKLLSALQISLPVTADNSVLSQLGFDLNFAANADQAQLSKLALKLDDTQIDATASIKNFAAPAVAADINISGINLDRYLPPPPPSSDTTAASTSTDNSSGDEPIELPLEMLRSLNLQLKLAIGQLQAKNLHIAELQLGVNANQGLIQINPLNATLYNGKLQTTASLDARSDTPVYATDLLLAGVQAGPLLKDFMDDDFIHGSSEAKVNISTQGNSVNQLKRALNGALALTFRDGALRDFNLAYELRKAAAKLKGKDLNENGSKATDFSVMSVSATIRNGVLYTDDLDMRAPLLRARGQGSVDLPQEQLDYRAEVVLTNELAGQGGKDVSDLHGIPIPVRVKGKFSDPKVTFEILEALKGDIDQKLAAEKARLQEQLKAEQAKAEAALKQKQAEAEAALKQKQAEADAALKQKQAEAEARLKEQQAKERKKAEEALKKKLNLP